MVVYVIGGNESCVLDPNLSFLENCLYDWRLFSGRRGYLGGRYCTLDIRKSYFIHETVRKLLYPRLFHRHDTPRELQ